MNEVKRYAIISDDWDYVESPSGGFVDHDDYAALEAECERLRVKLMTIASAEPARHGIEWAKAHAAEGNNEVYAKWREAIDEAHALAAELAAIKGQKPVGHVYTMQPCFPGEPKRAHAQLHVALPAGTKLYTLPAAPEGGEA